ncbi:MAG: hypothetical protein P8J37_10345 [Fuerstiella sp.]|nr:hypothetical protein [Fuerstiella sp.]
MNERELFLAAIEIPDPATRRAYLQSECGEDAELLTRVEALVSSHHGESRFLESPVVEQMLEEPRDETAATMMSEDDSTQDDQIPTKRMIPGNTGTSNESQDDQSDEVSLSYLEASTKPGSIGRLAHYEIKEVVGRGAFGTVLKAFDEKLHRVVAIKVLAPEMAATSPARKRFL